MVVTTIVIVRVDSGFETVVVLVKVIVGCPSVSLELVTTTEVLEDATGLEEPVPEVLSSLG
jgi:hypothetical protein